MRIDFEVVWRIIRKNLSFFLHGVKWTCLFAFIGTFMGFLIGLVLGGVRAISIEHTDKPFVRLLKRFVILCTRFYVWVFRGTPMMVQAVFIYYLFKPVFQWNSHTAGLVVISLNTGAYMAEIIRAGIQSIDPGQMEELHDEIPEIVGRSAGTEQGVRCIIGRKQENRIALRRVQVAVIADGQEQPVGQSEETENEDMEFPLHHRT